MNLTEILPDGRMTMLIDADIYLYRACSVTEMETYWGDDIWSLTTDLKESKDYFIKTIEGFQKELNIKDYILCLSSINNFKL